VIGAVVAMVVAMIVAMVVAMIVAMIAAVVMAHVVPTHVRATFLIHILQLFFHAGDLTLDVLNFTAYIIAVLTKLIPHALGVAAHFLDLVMHVLTILFLLVAPVLFHPLVHLMLDLLTDLMLKIATVWHGAVVHLAGGHATIVHAAIVMHTAIVGHATIVMHRHRGSELHELVVINGAVSVEIHLAEHLRWIRRMHFAFLMVIGVQSSTTQKSRGHKNCELAHSGSFLRWMRTAPAIRSGFGWQPNSCGRRYL
jgi:hypothetical protein